MLTDNSTDVQKCTSVYIYDTPMLPCQLHEIDNCTRQNEKYTRKKKKKKHFYTNLIP